MAKAVRAFLLLKIILRSAAGDSAVLGGILFGIILFYSSHLLELE
jgi:hypothetical protein